MRIAHYLWSEADAREPTSQDSISSHRHAGRINLIGDREIDDSTPLRFLVGALMAYLAFSA